jgi:hypothetical protein
MKKILPLTAVLALGLAGSALAQDKHDGNHDLVLKGKVLAVKQIDLGDPGLSQGDQQIITMDVFQGAKRVGESHVVCTMVRVDAATHAFTGQCDNVTSLPGGDIASSGLVTSAQEETTPFTQAITGGTGAYQRVQGQLTVDEAGPQPATLTFHLS